MNGLDGVTARLTMRVARRSSRRSFLAGLGKAAIVVAGAGAVVVPRGNRAYGLHECGHTGYSPNCPADFCPDIFGRCWFAADCCAGGGIKKICDCCSPNYPNVHGYCPDGYNVRCIVTSCGRHPREARPALIRVIGNDQPQTGLALARTLPGGAPSGVIVTVEAAPDDALIAPGISHTFATNVHLARRGSVDETVIQQLLGAGVREVWVLTPPDDALDERLRSRGFLIQRLPGRDAAERSAAAVYERARRVPLTTGVVVSSITNEAERWANLSAASAAAALGMALVVVDRDIAPAVSALVDAGVRRTIVVGDRLSAGEIGTFPGGQAVRIGGDPATASAIAVRALVAAAGRAPPEWMLVSGSPELPGIAVAAAATRVTIVGDGRALTYPTYAVIEDNALGIRTMWVPGTPGAVSDRVYMEAEDALKAYERDQYLGGYGIHLGPGT